MFLFHVFVVFGSVRANERLVVAERVVNPITDRQVTAKGAPIVLSLISRRLANRVRRSQVSWPSSSALMVKQTAIQVAAQSVSLENCGKFAEILALNLAHKTKPRLCSSL